MSAEPRFPAPEPAAPQRHLRLIDGGGRSTPSREPRRDTAAQRALVPEAAPRGSRHLFIALALSVLVILGLVLWTNILTAQRQYELVDLRAQEQSLSQQNESLNQEIEYHQAPQDLAERASQLGMVPATVSGSLDMQSGKIEGTPTAVTKNEKDPKNLIPAPSLNDTTASAEASKRAADFKKQEEERKKKEEESKKQEEDKAKKQEENKPATDSSASAAPTGQPSPSASAGQ
ncbi:hypothetical protein VVR12_03970 [Rothia sp. LK2588]|uniref:hypothetical protein n=1 Tax=Rothia sp. LK2588 TaxID=3114369 RepID=UPI0034CDB29E